LDLALLVPYLKNSGAPTSAKDPVRATVSNKLNLAAALQEIGTLLELKGGRYFQARAYKTAARVLTELEQSIPSLIAEDRVTSMAGVGTAIANQIKELYHTGTSRMLEQLRRELPRGAIELATIPGLSLKKIKQLQEALGISSAAELKAACEAGRVQTVKGFGQKTEHKLLQAIVEGKTPQTEIHIHKAWRLAEDIVTYLRPATEQQIEIAGAIRRWKETAPEIAIVVSADRPATVLDHFERFPLVIRTVERTRDSCTAVLNQGFRVTVRSAPRNQFGACLLNATGSTAHLARLADVAPTKKLRITAKGLEQRVSRTGQSSRWRKVASKSESDIYEQLGMQYVPPELREDEGEVQAATAGSLPDDLVSLTDVRGMVHCHTDYSDGKHTIEQMARGAEALGMSYLTITDHSPTAFYAGGVEVDRLQRQWDEIARVQETVKVKLLRGTESDILADGRLDYPDRILDQFDVIIASIHSRYRMDEDQMTRRITTAMRQPWFKVWGHALGRLIQHRPPFKCRIEEILDAIAESRAAIEINGDPYRLDMEPRQLRAARQRQIKFVISTDAHSVNGMKNLKFGIGIARRGWVRRGEVLNSLGTEEFQRAVRPGW
jgi:DNA polymerase (family 10)